MKKIFSLIVVLIILILPNYVNADMEAPKIKSYNGYVGNINGATYYTMQYTEELGDKMIKEGTYPYGQCIKVNDEIEFNGILYAGFYDENLDMKYVKLSDLSKVGNTQAQVDFSESKEMKVLANSGVEMYKGPAYGYEKVGTIIPKDTNLIVYKMTRPNDEESNNGEWWSDDLWYYVSYNGQNGWICILNGALGYKAQNELSIFIPKDINIYDECDYNGKNSKAIGKIPGNTIISDLLILDDWSESYYITYNEISGYVYVRDLAIECRRRDNRIY